MLDKSIRSFVITVFFLAPVLTSCINISEFNVSSSSGSEAVNELAFRLVRMCLADANRLITLIGSTGHKLAEEMNKSEFTALTTMSIDAPTIDKDYTVAKQSLRIYSDGFYSRFEHEAQGFILAAASQPILRRQIQGLKNSRWWKASGLLVIVDDGATVVNSCKNAPTFMWQAWRSGMLNSVFLCHNANGNLTIYSYSPYNSVAPKNWLKAGEYLGRYGHPWVLFKRSATDGPENCGDIFFDKTKTLDGYKIRSTSIPLRPRLSVDYDKTGLERYAGEEGTMMQSIFSFLNASLVDVPHTGKDPIGYLDEDGVYSGMLADVFSGRVDIGLNGRYMVDIWKLRMTYPHSSTDICYSMKSRGNVPQWINLWLVFDLWITVGLIAAALLTTLVLSRYTSLSDSCMNSLRLVISTSLVRLPSEFPARFFLINVFFLFLTANSMFQARWTALLTKPRAYGYPETETDLGNAGYELTGYPSYSNFIDDPVLRSHFVPSYALRCDQRIESGEDIVCIIHCDGIYIYVEDLTKFHIVSQRLHTFKLVFLTSPDWPLYDRFDQLVRRLSESGLLHYWKAQDIQIAFNSHNRAKYRGENRSPLLSISDLAFVFYGLLLALQVATLVFFYEVFSAWYRTRSDRISSTSRTISEN